MHPLEYLRSVARDPSSADRPWEAAAAFALLVADHGLGGPEAVPTARRLLERLAGRPELWWSASRIVSALDERTAAEEVLHAAAATGRVVVVQEAPRTCGFASEVAALLAERAILDLQAPVLRVAGYDVPYPYWQLEDAYMPSVERIVDAVRRLLAF